MIHDLWSTLYLIAFNQPSPFFEVNNCWIQTKMFKKTQFQIWYNQWLWWCFHAIAFYSNTTGQNTEICQWRSYWFRFVWPFARWEKFRNFNMTVFWHRHCDVIIVTLLWRHFDIIATSLWHHCDVIIVLIDHLSFWFKYHSKFRVFKPTRTYDS